MSAHCLVQQFDGPAQGNPLWTQLPGASSQRLGWPAAAGAAHRPVQQSWLAQQMSPSAAQLDAGQHLPPWQLLEQHSVGSVHASPVIPQVLAVGPGGRGWHTLPVQMPEQQSLLLEQLCVS